LIAADSAAETNNWPPKRSNKETLTWSGSALSGDFHPLARRQPFRAVAAGGLENAQAHARRIKMQQG
jgi:hypothetical protein